VADEAGSATPSSSNARATDTSASAEKTKNAEISAGPATPQQDSIVSTPLTQPATEPVQPAPATPVAESEKAGINHADADGASRPLPRASDIAPTQPAQTIVAPSSAPEVDSAADTPKLRIEAQELLVPVVVRDKQGHAVGNLTKDDFTLFDQGKAKAIRGFSIIGSASNHGSERGAGAAEKSSVADQAVMQSAAQRRFVIFLFDDRHVDASGLVLSQKAATHIMDEPLASNDYAAVLSLSGANSGITQDREALKAAITKLSVHAASQHGKEDCPDVDYYAANKIIRQHDPIEFQLTVLKAKKCSALKIFEPAGSQNLYDGMDNPTDPFQRMAIAAANRALAQGEEDAHQTFVQIETVVRAMIKLQGQRIIILLSPGFLSLAPDAMAFKSQILDEAARANVVINALDVRGLYAGNPDASQGENASLSQTIGDTSSDHLAGMVASENALAELSDGTGGTFFHNNNDLAVGLKSLAAAPEFVYLLGISLNDVKANGTFHQLKVKVKGRDLDVQARRGYFAPKH